MSKILRSHIFILMRSMFTWFSTFSLVIVICLTTIFAYYIFPLFGPETFEQIKNYLSFPNLMFHLTFVPVTLFGIVIGMFYCAFSIGNEYTWHTVRLPLLLGYPRWQVIISRWFTLSIVFITAIAVSSIIGVLVGLIGVRHLGLPILPLTPDISLIAVRILFISMIGVAVYMALVAVLATLTRSPLLSFAASLLTFLVDMFFGSMIIPTPEFAKYLLYFNLSKLILSDEGVYPNFSWRMMTIMGIYGLLFLFGMIIAFRKQHIYE